MSGPSDPRLTAGAPPPPPPAPYYPPPWGMPPPYALPPAAPTGGPPHFGALYGYGGVPIKAPGAKTLEGLLKFEFAARLAMYASLAAGLVGVVADVLFLQGTGPGRDASNFVATAGGAVVGIVNLVVFIFAVMGVSAFKDGRTEFGEERAKAVDRGIRLIIAAVLVYILGGVASGIVFVMAALASFQPGAGPPDPATFELLFARIMIAVALMTFVGVVIIAFAMQAFLQGLMTRQGRDSRSLFVALSVASGAAGAALIVATTIWFPTRFIMAGPTAGAVPNLSLAPFASFISVVSLYVYWRQVKDALLGVRAMIDSSSLDPDSTARTNPAGLPGAFPSPGPR